MIVEEMTKEELVSEVIELQKRISELERSETECRDAEEALREERDRAKRYLDVAGVMLLVIDADERVSLINKKGCDTLGYEWEEIVGKNWFDNFLPERIREETKMVFMALMVGEIEPVERHENPVLIKNGEERIIAFHNTILRDETGKATATLSSGEDITEYKRVQEALKESEDKFRDLAEKSIVGIYLIQDGVFKYVNPRLADIFGYNAEEVIDKMEVKNLIFPEDWPMVEKNLRKRVSGEVDSIHYGFRGLTKNQEVICVEVYGSRTVYRGRLAVIGTLLDITERKHSEEMLRESEDKYRTMVEQSNDMIWTLDREGNFVFFNKRAEEISGYRLEDWRGRNFSPLIVEEDLPAVVEAFRRTLDGEPGRYEVRIRKPDGNILILSVNTAPIFKDQEVIGTVSFGRDITELKRAQEELEKSAKEWQQTFDGALDIITLISPDYKFLKVNKAGCESLGKTQEELIGRKCYEVVHGLDHPLDGCPCAKMMETKMAGSGEINDHGRYYIATASPVLDENGGLVAFTHTVKDITESKKMEQALAESELKFRNLAEQSPNMVFVNQQGRVVYANKCCEELMGYTRDEFYAPNFDFMTLIAPDSRDLLREAYQKQLSGEDIPPFEYTLLTKDGQCLTAILTTKIIEYEGELAILGTITDITGRKRMERELQDTLGKLRKTLGATIEVIALTVEAKDPYTAGHQKRVANLARAIAQEMSLSEDQVEAIRVAGTIHDIGKISVPGEILSRPGKLSDTEMVLVRNHAQVGYEILKTIEFPWPMAQIVLQHHERMDGSGYPLGLSGEEILLQARILAVADAVEAMASHRPYRPALGIDEALDEVARNKGVLYDPNVVDACLRLFTEKGFELDYHSSVHPEAGIFGEGSGEATDGKPPSA